MVFFLHFNQAHKTLLLNRKNLFLGYWGEKCNYR